MGACSQGYLLADVRDEKWIIKVLRGKKINSEGVIDSFTRLKNESHLLNWKKSLHLLCRPLTKNDRGNLYHIALCNRSVSLNVI